MASAAPPPATKIFARRVAPTRWGTNTSGVPETLQISGLAAP